MMNATQLMTNIHRMKRLYERQFLRTCSRHGISQTEVDVLTFLANNPSFDTARDIAEMRMIAKSHISKSVEYLIRKGLLVRDPDKDDRRIIHLRLTDKSQPIVDEARLGQKRFAAILYAGMDSDQVATFETLLTRIFDNVTTETSDKTVGISIE